MGIAGALGRLFRGRKAPRLVPVLRTYSGSPEEDALASALVHRPIGADLGAFLAEVGPTDRGTLGIDYITHAKMEQRGGEKKVASSFEDAYANLAGGLEIRGVETPDGQAITIQNGLSMGTSALCLPNFYEQAVGWLGADEIFVGFGCPDELVLTTMGNSDLRAQLTKDLLASDYWGAVALTPAVYCMNSEGLVRLAAREDGR